MYSESHRQMSVVEKEFNSEEDLLSFAKEFAGTLKPGTTIGFSGPLGVGKTTFIRGMVSGLPQQEEILVQSPTFTLMNIYATTPPIVHLDLYRFSEKKGVGQELDDIGFRDALDGKQIVLIEWADRLDPNFLKPTKTIVLSFAKDPTARVIKISD